MNYLQQQNKYTPAQEAVVNSRNQLLASWGSMEAAIANLEDDLKTANEVNTFHVQGARASYQWISQLEQSIGTIHEAQKKIEAILG